MSLVNCPNCGEPIEDSSLRFCTSCGTPLAPTDEAAATPVAIPPSTLLADPPAVVETADVPVASSAGVPAPAAAPTPAAAGTAAVTVTSADVIAPVTPGAAAPTDAIVSRTRRSPFLPPVPPEDLDTPVISRAWAGVRASRPKGELTHERKMAGGLPDWEPLPPGEVLVKRASRR